MKGLLLKDFYNLSHLGKQYILILAAMSVWAYFMKNASFICMYVVLCSAMLVLTSFSYDEYAKFEKYALTMPIARKTLVQEKYVLLLIAVVGGMLAGIPLGGLMCLLVKGDFMESAAVAIVMGGLFLMSYGFVFPTIFKSGVEKARMMLVGSYLLIFLLVYGAIKLFGQIEGANGIPYLNWILPAAAIIAAAVVTFVSYVRSLRIIEKKEW